MSFMNENMSLVICLTFRISTRTLSPISLRSYYLVGGLPQWHRRFTGDVKRRTWQGGRGGRRRVWQGGETRAGGEKYGLTEFSRLSRVDGVVEEVSRKCLRVPKCIVGPEERWSPVEVIRDEIRRLRRRSNKSKRVLSWGSITNNLKVYL